MNFDTLKRRVSRREAVLIERIDRTRAHGTALRQQWRRTLTPTRIVVAGLVSGFAMGHLQPERALRQLQAIAGPRSIRTIASLTRLLASLQGLYAAILASAAGEAEPTHGEPADARQAEAAGSQTASGSDPTPGHAAPEEPGAERESGPRPPGDSRGEALRADASPQRRHPHP